MGDGFFAAVLALGLKDPELLPASRRFVPVVMQAAVPEASTLAALPSVDELRVREVLTEKGRAQALRGRRVRGGWGFVFFDSRNESDYTVCTAEGGLRLWRSVKALKDFVRDISDSDCSSFIDLE